jgi:hypothetical protein
MRCISIVRSLYFKIFSASFLITFLSPEIATAIIIINNIINASLSDCRLNQTKERKKRCCANACYECV